MKLIDIHTHIYPPAIARKAAASIREFYQLGTEEMDGTAETLLQRGDEAGIDRFVILPVSMRPERTRHINDFILSQVAVQPRFLGFGTIHAGMENITEEVQYIMDKGLRGLKMHPDSQVFAIDDERLFPAYEMLQGKLPVILHMGDKRYDYSHPARHECLYDKNCIFDVSSSMMFMEDGIAEKFINIYGAERMAFGTDYPLWNPVPETKRFLQLDLTDEQFEQIGHKTAERILNL